MARLVVRKRRKYLLLALSTRLFPFLSFPLSPLSPPFLPLASSCLASPRLVLSCHDELTGHLLAQGRALNPTAYSAQPQRQQRLGLGNAAHRARIAIIIKLKASRPSSSSSTVPPQNTLNGVNNQIRVMRDLHKKTYYARALANVRSPLQALDRLSKSLITSHDRRHLNKHSYQTTTNNNNRSFSCPL